MRSYLLLLVVGLFAIVGLALAPVSVGADVSPDPGIVDATDSDVANATDATSNVSFRLDAANATETETVFVRLTDPETTTLGAASGEPDRFDVAEHRAAVADRQRPAVEYLEDAPGVTVEHRFWITNAIVVTVDTDAVSLETALDGTPNAETVHPNYAVTTAESGGSAAEATAPASDAPARAWTADPGPIRPDATPFDVSGTSTTPSTTYGVSMVNAPTVWETHTRGEGARVAVLDTGVDADHPDVTLRSDAPDDPTHPGGWAEFYSNGTEVDGSEPHDTHGHGTHVSGTVAGGSASGTHVGVAPDAELMHGLVFPDGGATLASVLGGIEWAVANDADVVSMSLGLQPFDGESVYAPAFIEPIENARTSGTVVVAASGNAGEDVTTSPGNLHSVLSVGAVDEDRSAPDFSSGERIDTESSWYDAAPDDWPDEYVVPKLSAPGVRIDSTAAGGGYERKSGTSMAAPHVAGVAALLRATHPDRSVAEIDAAIRETSAHPDGYRIDPDTRHGTGIIDAHTAFVAADHDAWIEGTATFDGDPAGGVPIESDTGTTVTTAADGSFALPVEPGTRTLTADTATFGTVTETVEATAGDRTAVTFDLDRTVTAIVSTDQPVTVTSGEEMTIAFDVDHLDGYETTPTDDSTIDAEDLTVTVDDEPLTVGESRSYDQFSGTVSVTVVADAEGEFALEHVFEGTPEPVTRTTGPTTVTGPDPDAFSATDTRVSKRIPVHGTPLVETTIVNDDDVPRTPVVEWSSDGDDWTTLGGGTELAPGERLTVRERVDHDEPSGSLDHRIAVTEPGTTDRSIVATPTTELVDTGAGVTVTDTNVSAHADAGATVTTEVTVANDGSEPFDDLVWAEIDGSTHAAERVSLDPGETATVTLSGAAPDARGGYQHRVGTSTDVSEDPVYVDLDDYVTDDGRVRATELLNGAAGFRQGDIGSGLLLDLAATFRSGGTFPVS